MMSYELILSISPSMLGVTGCFIPKIWKISHVSDVKHLPRKVGDFVAVSLQIHLGICTHKNCRNRTRFDKLMAKTKCIVGCKYAD